MKIRTVALLSGLVGLGVVGMMSAGGRVAYGEEPKILDQGLGDGDKPAPAVGPEKKPEAKVEKAGANDVVNPDAVNKVDSDDLTKKLTGQGGEDGPEKVLKEVVDRMGESAQRLKDKDPGTVTQETQRRIVLNLDALIDIVKKSQSQSQGQGSGQPKPGEKKEQNQGQKSGSKPGQGQGGTTAAQNSSAPPGPSGPAESNGQSMQETRTEWGNLPAKDRDLVVHGSKEDALPSYRDMVQHYYQALADLGRSSKEK